MPRNVETKPRIHGTLDELITRIQPLADGPPRHLNQSDTFFACPTGGRLKLRIEQVRFGLNLNQEKFSHLVQGSPAQLIYYELNDVASLAIPKLSDYSIAPISHPDELKVRNIKENDRTSIDVECVFVFRKFCHWRWVEFVVKSIRTEQYS